MSYLQLPEGIPDFNKAVISLWFRVPQSSIDAARAMYVADDFGIPMTGIVPLLTFGKRLKRKDWHLAAFTAGSYQFTLQHWSNGTCSWITDTGYPTEAHAGGGRYEYTDVEFDLESSYIGIDCTAERNLLSINIQMNDRGDFDGSWPEVVESATPDKLEWPQPVSSDGSCENYPETDADGYVVPVRSWHFTDTFESNADVVLGAAPEVFRTLPPVGNRAQHMPNEPIYDGPEIVPDRWHHLLLSFDFSTPCDATGTLLESGLPSGELGAVSGACKMWVALDDINLTGKAMSAYWPDAYVDLNAVLTPNTYFVFRDIIAVEQLQTAPFNDLHGNIVSSAAAGLSIPTGDYTPGMVPSASEKLGIPATDDYLDFILPVEMAEFQLFTGVAIDTGPDAGRRAFVDENGVPVSPTEHQLIDEETGLPVVDDEGKPVMLPPPAVELLGQTPDILLHGSGNWSRGINTGPPDDADPLDDDLDPTGLIASYKPGPSLHGPQSPEDIPEARRRAAAR